MRAIMKSIRRAENKFDQGAKRFTSRHPYVASVAMFIGMPVFLVGGVAAATTAIAFPLALLFGWM